MIRYAASSVGILALLLAVASPAAAQVATQNVNFEVMEISDISVSGDPGQLTLSTTTGGVFDPVIDNSTTYSVAANGATPMKITGELDADMPGGLELRVELVGAAGSVSAGPVLLTSTAADLVNNIDNVNQTGLQIEYELSSLGIVPAQTGTRVVTFTLTADI